MYKFYIVRESRYLIFYVHYAKAYFVVYVQENSIYYVLNVKKCTVSSMYRSVLREEGCLSLLLVQLRSPSLTIVSNSCGTLWNFSARSRTDQELLWELGAVQMLQSLTNSKHKTISECSVAALKNLYTARPEG